MDRVVAFARSGRSWEFGNVNGDLIRYLVVNMGIRRLVRGPGGESVMVPRHVYVEREQVVTIVP